MASEALLRAAPQEKKRLTMSRYESRENKGGLVLETIRPAITHHVRTCANIHLKDVETTSEAPEEEAQEEAGGNTVPDVQQEVKSYLVTIQGRYKRVDLSYAF